ncbi:MULTISPECIES: hypothetical protein [Nostocales]|uniref:hypothetical protein n=1 Tax=Nostocales TaxID=1161 RepID=UPI0010FA81F5
MWSENRRAIASSKRLKRYCDRSQNPVGLEGDAFYRTLYAGLTYCFDCTVVKIHSTAKAVNLLGAALSVELKLEGDRSYVVCTHGKSLSVELKPPGRSLTIAPRCSKSRFISSARTTFSSNKAFITIAPFELAFNLTFHRKFSNHETALFFTQSYSQ